MLPLAYAYCAEQAKLKFLRTSNLWRQAVRRWRHQVQATLASRRDAAAVAAMEAQRRQHEADAQRRLAWVDEALLQRTLVDTTCPVCDKDAGQTPARTSRVHATWQTSDWRLIVVRCSFDDDVHDLNLA